MNTPSADTVVLSDRVLTMTGEENEPGVRTAVCIRDGKIAAVLPADAAQPWIGEHTVVHDFGDRTVMPGFVDPHAHSEVAAKATYQMVDVRAPECPDIPSVLQRLRDSIPQARDGWLVGQANLFFDQKLAEGRFPTRGELDSVSTELAVAVRAGGHLSILNSRALELAGITSEYEAVDYSITGKPTVQRDEAGKPTGVITEMDKLIPFPSLSDTEIEKALEQGITELFTANGVTTIGEISESVDGLRTFDRAIAAKRIGVRMHVYLWAPGTVTLEEACTHAEWTQFTAPPERMSIRGVKVFADGGYSAKRAALSQPYADDSHSHGELALSVEQVAEIARATRSAGLQLAIHANGDWAQLSVCEALAKAAGELTDGPGIRIEHAGNFVPDYDALSAAWKAAAIVPVPQPVFIYNFGEFMPDYLGEYARERQFPFRRMLDDGWPISGSSDVWVGSEVGQTNPFLSIASAVARRTFHGQVLSPEQAVTTYEALQMHTIAAAQAMEIDDTRGTIETGKYADLIVLDDNPLTANPDRLLCIRVTDVLLGGEQVYTGGTR
ncbi:MULTISPECIES: amidohydrolase [Rhodococcus]|uniref:Putative periplasmic protein n=1 Tax=Rhodococcus pyridinivorans AK37 TaxID=1114960 RepID=H0JUE0_9NOCA|nr:MULTISPECIES: amidohydrolase [Rhodococcus]EHK82238.1 putative periplasmic protein [Rhodococcus pyridinivorans AK37]